jgi:hypothetical protein
MTEARLLAARWLVDGGAGASACRLLEGLGGAEANDVREASAASTLRTCIYALVAHDGGGLVLPLSTRVGLPSAASSDLRDACARALAAARAWFDVPSLPALRLDLEELLAVSGASLGLPAALAFVTHFAPAAAPRRAVLATGRLDAEGRIHPVGHIREKLAAAYAESGERIVLVPSGQRTSDEQVEVRSLAEAIAHVLGAVHTPDASLMKLDALIVRARAEPDPLFAASMLEAIDLAPLAQADRGRVHLELGTALRHAGRTDAAAEHHALATRVMTSQRLVVGAETAERYELEVQLTAMDEFRLAEARAALSARLCEPFLSARNELRARGMLAQVLAMQGEYAEAVRVRMDNLALHELSDDLRGVLPGTLCYLALDAARAGDAAGFEANAARLLRETRPGDAAQWRYSSYALVRALVALGRDEEAIAWAEGRAAFGGVGAPPATSAMLRGAEAITRHPECALARVLVRAYGRVGDRAGARALGGRVVTKTEASGATSANLVSWLVRLVELEMALVESHLGVDPSARLAAARAELAVLHRAASEHHAGLLTCPIDGLESELDRVFY